jgi:hypothetical protein
VAATRDTGWHGTLLGVLLSIGIPSSGALADNQPRLDAGGGEADRPQTLEEPDPHGGCGNSALANERWKDATARTALAGATVTITVRYLKPEGEIDRPPIVLSRAELQELERLFNDPANYSDCPGVIAAVCEGVVVDVRTENRDTRSWYCQGTFRVFGFAPDALDMILSGVGAKRWEEFVRSVMKAHA